MTSRTRRKKQPKFIKNTPSGKRALAGARAGKDKIKNPGGSVSSILTGSYGTEIKGKPRQVIVPHIVKEPSGKMRKLAPGKEAFDRAMETGDFAVAKSVRVATRRSKKFSKRLGKITQKVNRKKSKAERR